MPASRGSSTASFTIFKREVDFDIQKAYLNTTFLDVIVMAIIIIPLRLSIIEEGKTTIILNVLTFGAAIIQISGIVYSLIHVLYYQRAPDTALYLNLRLIFLCFFLAEFIIRNSIECLGNKEDELHYSKCTGYAYWLIGYIVIFILECFLFSVIKATLQHLDLALEVGSIQSYLRDLRRRNKEKKEAKIGMALEVKGEKISQKAIKNAIITESRPCELRTKGQIVRISLIEKGHLSRGQLLSTKASIEPLSIKINHCK